MKLLRILAILIASVLLSGCVVGRTGKIGKPISDYYQVQLESLKLGESTPEGLKKLFLPLKAPVALKEAKLDGDKKLETWQVTKGGDVDVAELLIWGGVAYNKDQELLFHFENGKLTSYESIVIPDPQVAPVSPALSPHSKAP